MGKKKRDIENKEEKNQERIRKKESTTQKERKVSLYTKERDMRSDFEPMNLFMNKEAYLHETNHNSSLPITVISLLQEPKDFTTHIAKSNNGASKVGLFRKFNMSAIFNAPDLFLFDVGDDLRTHLFKEGGNNGDHNIREQLD